MRAASAVEPRAEGKVNARKVRLFQKFWSRSRKCTMQAYCCQIPAKWDTTARDSIQLCLKRRHWGIPIFTSFPPGLTGHPWINSHTGPAVPGINSGGGGVGRDCWGGVECSENLHYFYRCVAGSNPWGQGFGYTAINDFSVLSNILLLK